MSRVRMVVHADFPNWDNYDAPLRSLINFFIKDSACFFKGNFSGHGMSSMSGNIRTKLHPIMEIDNDLSVFSIPESVELNIAYTDQSLPSTASDFLPDCTSTLVSKQSTLKLCKIDAENVETYTGGIDPIDSIIVNLYSTIGEDENENPLYRPCNIATNPGNIVEVPIRSDVPDFYSDYQLRTSSFYIEDSTFTISADVYYKIGICPLDKKYPYKDFSSTPVTPGMTLNEIKALLLQNEEVLINGNSTYVNGLYYKLLKCTVAIEKDSFNSGNYGLVSSLLIPIVNSSNQIIGLGYIKLFNQDGTEFTANIKDKELFVCCRPNENGTPEDVKMGDQYGLRLSITNQKLSGGYIQSEYTKDIVNRDHLTEPLMFLSKQDGSTVRLNIFNSDVFQTSSDGNIWEDYSSTKTLNNGEKLYVRCKTTREAVQGVSEKVVTFSMTGKIEAYNNINSLLSPDFSSILDLTPFGRNCFLECFDGCVALMKAPLLPATTIAWRCYYHMFYGCTSLTKAPKLPATTLSSDYCYSGMFLGCTSLTKAPELPATILSNYCYEGMFWNCTSLVEAPELPATTISWDCYDRMFLGCTSLTKAPELPATTLVRYCYYHMFYGCTSLIEAPELPASTLVADCYSEMFSGCTQLNKVIIHATDISASNCLSNWLNNVSSIGSFYCKSGVSYPTGVSGIPSGWTRYNI